MGRRPHGIRAGREGAPRSRACRLLPLAAALILAGCPDRESAPELAEAPLTRFEAAIQGIGEHVIEGKVRLELEDDVVRARLQVTGLPPGAAVSQHVYAWWDCTTIGRILINLDTNLSIPGEGPPRGEAYPPADDQGRLDFTAERPRDEIVQALHNYRGMLFDELDLGNRTVFLRDEGHRAIACGELRAVD